MLSEEQLRAMIERFLAGDDRSIALAGEIEVALDQLGQVEPFSTVALALASYRPEGGPFLYDEKSIIPVLQTALTALGRSAATKE